MSWQEDAQSEMWDAIAAQDAGRRRPDLATCGACGLTWDDGKVTSMTPAPAARCPFEEWHHDDDTETDPDEIPADWPVQPVDAD